jgi:anti-sigma regulatory factor (Ser/Thr protein kinase)
LRIHVVDHGVGAPIPDSTSPNLEAKLEGLQSPRGWGLFLIKNMVDEMNLISDADKHTIELVFYLTGQDEQLPNE